MKATFTIAAVLLLIGAGCNSDDQTVVNKLIDPSPTDTTKPYESADKELELDPFLSPGSIAPDIGNVTGGCIGIEPFDTNKYIGASVLVWKLTDGRCYPSAQFTYRSDPDRCKDYHYHFDVMSLDGHVRKDSQPCGSVTNSDVVEGPSRVRVSPWQYKPISDQFKKFRDRE